MRNVTTSLLLASFLLPGAVLAEEGHFPPPPATSHPVAAGKKKGPKAAVLDNNHAPESCDPNVLLGWMREWRQKARIGSVNQVMSNMPKLVPGADCIHAPEAYDVHYEANGDYFVASCLAQKNGKLAYLYRMELVAQPDPACLGDQRFQDYIHGTQCHMPGGNQRFLNEVMWPCKIRSPEFRPNGQPKAFPIDPGYFANLLNARPDIGDIVDRDSRKVKAGPTDHDGGDSGCNNPFTCGTDSPDDGGSGDAK